MSIEILRHHKASNNDPDGKEWFYPVIDGKKYSHIAESEDLAMLVGLGIKYDGINSQFAKMAARMLNLETVWRD